MPWMLRSREASSNPCDRLLFQGMEGWFFGTAFGRSVLVLAPTCFPSTDHTVRLPNHTLGLIYTSGMVLRVFELASQRLNASSTIRGRLKPFT